MEPEETIIIPFSVYEDMVKELEAYDRLKEYLTNLATEGQGLLNDAEVLS